MDNYLERDLDDILFEHRNRAYGSYALRKSYNSNMKKASMAGLGVFLLLISSPLIADKIKFKSAMPDNTFMEMVTPPISNVKKPDIPKPPQLPPPPVKKIAMMKFLPPVVTLDREKEAPPIVPPIDVNVQIGNHNQEGEKTTAYVPPSVPSVSLPPPPDKEEKKVVEEDKVILFVEQPPEFPDGLKAMYKFMSDNIRYPTIARENGIEGTVYVGFVVGRDGAIRDVVVKRGIGGGCNEEAVRVIQMMPKWKAGKQNSKAVSVAFTLPVKFKLE